MHDQQQLTHHTAPFENRAVSLLFSPPWPYSDGRVPIHDNLCDLKIWRPPYLPDLKEGTTPMGVDEFSAE